MSNAILVMIVWTCVASTAVAQVQTTTDVRGTVVDSSGAFVAGATVSARNQGTGAERTTNTDSVGAYVFPSLLPGIYTVTVMHAGFKRQVVTDRSADVAQPARVDVTLEIGQPTESVTVSAAGADLINTETAEISGTISGPLVENLPLSRRDFLDLASLTPGSGRQDAMGNYTNNSSNQVSFAQGEMNRVQMVGRTITSGIFAAGNRDSAANVSVDGSNVQSATFGQTMQFQSISDIQEVKVESGIMNPEFGFGATAVNVVTKGGGNAFHGEAFEFLRNDNLDANDFFAGLAGRKLPEYKTNQFGGSIGGAILKNKLHFFGNYEGLRVRQSAVSMAAVPPAQVHNGDFSTIVYPGAAGTTVPGPIIYNPYRVDPATGLREPFPGNVIPLGSTNLCSPRPTCVDPVALAMLNLTPNPNAIINGLPNYVGIVQSYTTADQYTGRVDWDASSKDRVFARFTHFKNFALGGGLMSMQGSTQPYGSENPTVS